jgi:hypothetical protein
MILNKEFFIQDDIVFEVRDENAVLYLTNIMTRYAINWDPLFNIRDTRQIKFGKKTYVKLGIAKGYFISQQNEDQINNNHKIISVTILKSKIIISQIFNHQLS